MGKIRQILGFFATLLMIVFAQNAWSAGYTCASTYTSCNAGYFMPFTGICASCPANSTSTANNTSSTCTCNDGYVNSSDSTSTSVGSGESCVEDTIKVTFSCGEGSEIKTLPAAMDVKYNEAFSIDYAPEEYCERDGYHVKSLQSGYSGSQNYYDWILTTNSGDTQTVKRGKSITYDKIMHPGVTSLVVTPDWGPNNIYMELLVNGKRDMHITDTGYYVHCEYGSSYTLPVYNKTGYTFEKWTASNGKTYTAGATVPCTYAETGSYGAYLKSLVNNDDGTAVSTYVLNDGTEVTSDTDDYISYVLDATYKASTSKVIFDCGTGTGTAPATLDIQYDSTFKFPNNTCTNSTSTFAGWKYTANGAEHEYNPGTSITWNYLDEEVTMVAQWDSCTGCKPGEGATCSLNTSSGSCVYTTSCLPGYSNIRNSGTATPQCTPITYNITYNIIDAIDSSVAVTLDSPIGNTSYTIKQAVTLPTPSATGYTFGGWYTNSSFTGTAVTSLPVGTTGDKTYYAKMIPESYHLQYNCNGGSGTLPTPEYFYYNRTVTVGENVCTHPTATFRGWKLSSSGAVYMPGATFQWTHTGNQVLTAQWSECTACNPGTGATCSLNASSGSCVYTTSCLPGYTSLAGSNTPTPSCSAEVYNITWNLDGGSVTEALPTTHTYGTRTDVDITPTKTGYTFAGWCTSNPASGSAECTPAITITATEIGDFEFWASWTVNTYSVSYDCGANGTGSPAGATVQYGTDYRLPAASVCTPNVGYKFAGWSSGTATYPAYQYITWTYTKDVTFTAQYALESDWTITYETNGGTISGTPTTSYNINSGTIQLPNVTYPGHNFEGWSLTQGNAHDVITAIYPGTHTGDLTLYAIWSTCNSTSAGTCYCAADEYPKYGTCTDCQTQCSTLGDGWTGTYDICTTGSANTMCTKSCTVQCTAPVAPQSDRGTVTYTNESKTGTIEYGSPNICSQSAYACPDVVYSCNQGFTYVAAATNAADICSPNIYAITLNANGGTGGTATVYEKYSVGFYSTSTATTAMTKITVPTRTNYAFGGYKDTSGNVVIGADGVLPSNKTFLSDTTLTAVWSQTVENCVAGKYMNNGTWTTCVAPYYCDAAGEVSSGTTGCNDTCPAGGYTSNSGSTTINDCHKVITDDSKNFENGTAQWDCYYTSGSGDSAVYNTNCRVVPLTCDAGYYYAGAGVVGCSPVGNGYYSADDELERQFCEGGDGSISPRDSINTCYVACDKTVDDVAHSTSVTSTNDDLRGMWNNGEYETCEYTLTCETGYTPVPGATPSCDPVKYTVYLDKNGGTGDVAESVQCTFDSGSCTLPVNRALSRPGYLPLYKWCTDKAGKGTCYTAGSNVAENLSADGSNVTLFAAWQPNIFEITISADGTDQAADPQTVYLKYATGWYLDGGEVQGITSLNTKPALAGYTFVGVNTEQDNSGVMIVDSTGKFLTTEEALTAVTDNSIVYPMWAAGTTHCDPGYYYPGTGNECSVCEPNSWCPGGDFGTDTGNVGGLNSCPEAGFSAGGVTATDEGVCYQVGLEYVAANGAGTQTCFWGGDAYDRDCNDIVITSCVAGHYYETGIDCSVVGNNWYSPNGPITRTACPNNGVTDTATAATVNECFKTGLAYTPASGNGSGTQTCTYTSGEGSSAKYETDCRDKVITKCNGGYYRENASAIDCVEVGQNYYSEKDDVNRDPCPEGGLTSGTTATASTFCYKTDTPYVAEHGSGVQLCYYNDATSVYDTNCGTIIMQQCDDGYWWENDQDADCSPVDYGYYGPVAHETFTNYMIARQMCPDDGLTATQTSASAAECYHEEVECEIANGSGLQTCNYDEATGNYTNCTTCEVDGCGAGYYELDGKCEICPEGMVCDPTDPDWDGEPKTCSELTNGSHKLSDEGISDINMCYTTCAMGVNATEMSGRDYYGITDTCEITACAAGYFLNNGRCDPCPAGSVCDPSDPDWDGEPKTCAEMTGGKYTMSETGNSDVNMCYADCAKVENATEMTGVDYYGENVPDSCEVVSCEGGYYVKDGEACIICPEGGVCYPGSDHEPKDCYELTGGTHAESDLGTSDESMCYTDCQKPENVMEIIGRDYYGIADTCEVTICDEGYYLSDGACVVCPAGSVCDPHDPDWDGEPKSCSELTGGTHTMSDAGNSDINMCYTTCATGANAAEMSGRDYYGMADTCEIAACGAGYYLSNGTCEVCPAGSVCDPSDPGWDDKPKTCSTLTGGTHTMSDAGISNVNQCYATCAMGANAAEMSGRDYYGMADTCEITACAAGYFLSNGACVLCPEGMVCDPSDPDWDGEPKSCSELTGGTHILSVKGASKAEQCYANCPRTEIENGVGVAAKDTVFWPEQCDYTWTDPDGNPCKVVDGVCVVTECRTGYEMKSGHCEACDRENALTYNNTGVCAVETCVSGYHPNGSRCDANVVECSAPNAVAAQQVWNKNTKSYGICTITECAEEYHLMSNACVADIQDCVVENGIGIKEWNHVTKSWGECQATVCDPGYTNDKFETNEHSKQCGQCKNKFSVLGEVAVSSYVNGCEIATCMYQGEKYILEGNECIPICSEEEHRDETGYMYWDDYSKKCIRECYDGYMPW
ncbi:MAG: InlB B-repeat-containing protein [Alphaproteobacteria bacterium]|nr:InlB B-repeat-containing protein [Alphaproteobacteria bacterium]